MTKAKKLNKTVFLFLTHLSLCIAESMALNVPGFVTITMGEFANSALYNLHINGGLFPFSKVLVDETAL